MIFLKHFFKSTKHTGAVAQSSRFLAEKMLERSNLGRAKIIVELGPGMGAITKKIIKEKPAQSKLLTVEINKEFVEHLNRKYPEAVHVHSDIIHLKGILKENGIEYADVIISGIPFTSLEKEECEKMLETIRGIMHKNSRLVLFAYSPIKFRSFYKYFKKIDLSYVTINIPPAYVLTLEKK